MSANLDTWVGSFSERSLTIDTRPSDFLFASVDPCLQRQSSESVQCHPELLQSSQLSLATTCVNRFMHKLPSMRRCPRLLGPMPGSMFTAVSSPSLRVGFYPRWSCSSVPFWFQEISFGNGIDFVVIRIQTIHTTFFVLEINRHWWCFLFKSWSTSSAISRGPSI